MMVIDSAIDTGPPIGYIRGNNVKDGSLEDPRMPCNQAGVLVRTGEEDNLYRLRLTWGDRYRQCEIS